MKKNTGEEFEVSFDCFDNHENKHKISKTYTCTGDKLIIYKFVKK